MHYKLKLNTFFSHLVAAERAILNNANLLHSSHNNNNMFSNVKSVHQSETTKLISF